MTQKHKVLIAIAGLALLGAGTMIFIKKGPKIHLQRVVPTATQVVTAPQAPKDDAKSAAKAQDIIRQTTPLTASAPGAGIKQTQLISAARVQSSPTPVLDVAADENNLRISVQCDVSGNPKWKPFATYLETISTITQDAWRQVRHDDKLPNESIIATVAITVSNIGEVEIRYVDTKNGKLEGLSCAEAVKKSSPYRVWTEPMKKSLEDSEDILLIFTSRTVN